MKFIKNIVHSNFFVFISLSIIVFYLQYNLLQAALNIGLSPDDWSLRFYYKSLGPNPLSKIAEVWAERGAHTTYQVYYLGFLENLVGFDYRSFQMTNVIFKTLATLAIFPLILIIFKNRLLAFLTTVLYAISHAAAGSLEFVVKGSDYLAILWMSVFLMVYYLKLNGKLKNSLWLIVCLILLILTLTFSPIRLFPLLAIPVLVEIYLMLNNRNTEDLKKSLIRLAVLYLPFFSLIIYRPDAVLGYLNSPFGIYNKIIEGNWHLILSPFSGMGYTFITSDYWSRIFGLLSVDDFKKYIYFLLGGPTVIFGSLTLIVAFIKSRRPMSFFLSAFLLNLFLEIIIFFIATHMSYDPNGLYSTLFGIYILVLGCACFIEWLNKKDDKVLMALWVGPAFLFIFTFLTWAFAPLGTGFSPTSYYLVVGSLGAGIFTCALLVAIYERLKLVKIKVIKIVILIFLLLVVMANFLMSRQAINTYFTEINKNGRSSSDQQDIQSRFKLRIKDIDMSQANLFYFDPSEIHAEGRFYTESFLSSFPFWMHFDGNELIDGCLGITYEDRDKLVRLIRVDRGKRGFLYRSLCVENGKAAYKEILYGPENFYAYKLKNKDFIDIRDEVLKELGFE